MPTPSRTMSRLLLWLALAILPFGLLPTSSSVGIPALAEASVGGLHSLYLPLIKRPTPASVFGGQIQEYNAAGSAPLAREAGLTWTRVSEIPWAAVEPTPGARNWAALARQEAALKIFAENGLTPLLIIQNSPAWAQKVPGATCGAIREDALDEFAAFMGALVTRMSAPPYNVRYYEIGNEPDVDPALLGGGNGSVFGCWGDSQDEYYGGGYYAEMLKRVYPAIKQANPRAQVVLGGLLLFCDHTNAASCGDPKPSRFFEGILRHNGQMDGGNYFDIVSYHGYPLWSSVREDWELNYGLWRHRGGVVLGKLDFLRTTMTAYGVSKPVILSEAGLICTTVGACPAAQLQADQANYAVRLFSRALGHGLLGALWYTFEESGWRDSGLIGPTPEFQPRPAYQTVSFLSNKLAGAQSLGQLSSGNLEGYAFSNRGKIYRVYWTNTNTPVSVVLPSGASVFNKFGQPLAVSGGSIVVNFEPIVMESNN